MSGWERAGGRSGGGDETGSGFVTAWAEMGSATSRNPGGCVYNVKLAGPHRSVIVAGGLREAGARRVAEAINELLGEARGRLETEPSCRQQAYRRRRRA